MSIQSEINRISGNVSDALDAVAEKGVTVPSDSNSDNLPSLIRSITMPQPATATPLADGTAAVGSSTAYAREDHVHPIAGAISKGLVYYATCSTAAGTQKKTVTISEITSLYTGLCLRILFTNKQTYNGVPTLQINSLTATNIRRVSGTNAARYEWNAGEVLDLVYDGTYFVIVDGAVADATYYGITKLSTSSTSTSEVLAATPSAVNKLAQYVTTGLSVYSSSATYAVGDRVRYGSYMYECNTAISTAEAWTAAHWTALDPLLTQIETKASKSQGVYYGECSTAAATQAKTVSIDGIATLYAGLNLRILFTYAQGYNGTPTLNVNSLGAKSIVDYSSPTASSAQYGWQAGEVLDLVYDGTNFVAVDGCHANTTYFGVTKLSSDMNSDSEFMAATPKAIKTTESIIAPVLDSMVADTALHRGEYRTINGVTYRINESIASGGDIENTGANPNATAVGGEGYGGIASFITRKNNNRSEKKVFPKNASEISNGNNMYKVGYDGTFYLTYTFADTSYSQFGIQINGNAIGDNISSASKNYYGLTQTIAIPVIKGDVISVTFYSTYGMFSISGYLFY